MNVEQKVNIHNRFDIHIDNIETGEHREVTAYNIVLDQMWTRLCGGSSYFVNIHFGIGTGTPIASRTSLFSHLGTKTAVDVEQVKALPVSRWKRKVVLNPEEFVGQTITEVGIAFGSTASNLVTHAMLKDSEGNPISITKSDTDVVTIFATVFVTINNQTGVSMIGMPSGNQLINYLVGGTAAPTGSFGLLPFIGAYSQLGSTATVTWTSDVPNKKRKTNVPRFGISDGNGHAKVLEFTNLFNVEFPTSGIFTGQPYIGVSVGTGDGVKTKFTLPSANIRQASLALKIADVVVSNYTKKMLLKDFTKVKNPDALPTGDGQGVALTPDGLVMAVAHDISPFITTYDWVGGAWVKRPNPAVLPTSSGQGVALTPDGLIMAVAYYSSPFITTYDWVEGAWIKRPNPAVLPTSSGQGVSLTPDGLVMAVGHSYSPYVTTYKALPFTEVTFDSPPTGAITADYIVDGVHKTDQYVIDVSFSIQFGEGA